MQNAKQQQISMARNFSNPMNALLEALWHLAAATICQGPPTQSHQAFYQLLLIQYQQRHTDCSPLIWKNHFRFFFLKKLQEESFSWFLTMKNLFKRLGGSSLIFQLTVIQVQFQHWVNHNYSHYLDAQIAVLPSNLKLSRILETLFCNCTWTTVIPCCTTWKSEVEMFVKELSAEEDILRK